MSTVELDDLDRRILDLLGKDARLSNRSIARELGLVEGTIRARIKRMQAGNLLRFTAITDDRRRGRPNLALIRIRAETARARQIGVEITEMREILSVIALLGRFSLVAVGMFETLESLADFVDQRISTIAGVQHVESSIVVKSIKFNERMAKLGVQRDLPILDDED